jgi:hypothetical protein
MGCDFSELLQWNARRNSHLFSSIISELFFVSILKLNMMHSFKRLLINFEGNCFERACIQAFKKSCDGEIIGYCHGVIYPLNLKLRVTSAEAKSRPEPDLFVCTGDYSKYLFMKIGKRDASKIRSGCSLRYIPQIISQPFENKELKHVLFALDGANSSSALLDWIIEHSEKLKKFNLLIRAHPNVPFKRLLDQCISQCRTDIKHSDGNLSDDLSKSWCVVYRQTSIGMQALLNGIPAIHLSVDIPLPGDPLYDLNNMNWRASNIEELLNILENISKSGLLVNKSIKNENKIVSEYFRVPSNVTMNDFL